MNLGLVKYNLYSYNSSGKYVLPLIIYGAWIAMAYSIHPVEMLESLGFSALLNFVCMLVMGVSFTNHKSPMIEMSFLVRLSDKKHLYTSRLVCLFLYSLILSTIGVLAPMINHTVHGFTLFNRPVAFSEVVICFAVMLVASLCGAAGGTLFNSRIFKNDTVMILSSVLWAMISVFRAPMMESLGIFRFLLWLFPPIHELARSIIDTEFFVLTNTLLYLGLTIIYTIIFIVGYINVLLKLKVE